MTLIEIFEDEINKLGGIEKAYHLIHAENVKFTKKRFLRTEHLYSGKEVDYIQANYKTQTIKQMARHFGRSFSAMRNKVHRLQEQGLLNYKQIHTS